MWFNSDVCQVDKGWSLLVSFVVTLTQPSPTWEEGPQLCDHTGLWTCLQGLVLIDSGGPGPLWVGPLLGQCHELGKKQAGHQLQSGSKQPCSWVLLYFLLESLPSLPSVMKYGVEE